MIVPPSIVTTEPTCWPRVVVADDGLSCRVGPWLGDCRVRIGWRLPPIARTGRIVVDGACEAERLGIWLAAEADVGTLLTVRRPSDIDGDGYVDAADLSVLLGDWATNEPRSDLNIDGTVDGADHALLLGAWGTAPKALA